jgi:hypothetical protein
MLAEHLMVMIQRAGFAAQRAAASLHLSSPAEDFAST